jgi:hypothetical protein
MKKQIVMAGLVVVLMTACGDEEKQARNPAEVSKPAGREQTMPAAGPSAGITASVDKAVLIKEAGAAAQELGGTLKEELEGAMKVGGPIEAMDICSVVAPEIAQMISEEQGMEVGRVSLKSRNSVLGVPNGWQTMVLHDFETRRKNGEDLASLVYAEVIDNQFRFMKAIPTAAVCLHCHGTNLTPEVKANLTELYPQDKATGYNEGDLRGAFVVIKNLGQ